CSGRRRHTISKRDWSSDVCSSDLWNCSAERAICGWFQQQIARSAEQFQRALEARARVIVGVNDFTSDDDHPVEILKVSNDVESGQRRRLAQLRAERDNGVVADRLEALRRAALEDTNVIGPMLDCARAYCTLYEIRHALERVYGAYREPVFF